MLAVLVAGAFCDLDATAVAEQDRKLAFSSPREGFVTSSLPTLDQTVTAA